MDGPDLVERVDAVMSDALSEPVAIEELTHLPGGASKDTWSFAARGAGGEVRAFVLRRDRGRGSSGSGLLLESALLAAAREAGVPVPRVVASGGDLGGGSGPFIVMDFVDGETIARRILRDEAFAAVRPALAGQCGEILAAIHRIPVSAVPGLAGGDLLDQLRSQLEQLGQPHPAFELGLAWLAENRPPAVVARVVHGDFRNGNLIVGPDGIRAVLDWELAHLGDPLEDLGWLCVKAWRFGSPLPVGGFGTVEQLVAAYEAAGGGPVDAAALRWWIAYGTLRWGIICIAQTLTHTSGVVRSVELAAIGRRVCEVESDLLELLPWGTADLSAPAADRLAAWQGTPHDIPSAAQLLDAVRGFLESDVLAATEGRVQFHVRVAANVVAMVGRELEIGGELAAEHAVRLAGLGVASEAELAAAIRSGAFDDRLAEVSDAVRATVAGKLAVANPRYGQPRATAPGI